MLHDPADHRDLPVTDGIDVDFDRIRQETVDQHRMFRADGDRFPHVLLELVLPVDDPHRPAPQDV